MENYELDNKISLKAKFVMYLIKTKSITSIKDIEELCKDGSNSIHSALSELKQHNYIRITKLMPNSTKSGRIEYLYEVIQ